KERSLRRLRWGVGMSLTLAGLAIGAALLAWGFLKEVQQAQAVAKKQQIELLLRRGAWAGAQHPIQKADAHGFPEDVWLQLMKVKTRTERHQLEKAETLLMQLARRADLKGYKSSVDFWLADMELAKSPFKDHSGRIRAADKADLSPADKPYATAL